MNGVELFLLGRTLMKIGEEAMPTEGLRGQSTSVRSVLIVASDIVENPGSAVGEIAGRTGLPQSQVSGCVARLREAGAVVTEPDPADRRRVLIHQAPEASGRVEVVRSTTIDTALGTALGTGDPDAVAEVVAALETLAQQLTPATLSRLRPPSSRSRSSAVDG
ncbi:MarR family winged helix-turn-helix transcriptional regulator [Nocardia sp. NBC_00416]|uniref:MarR family winged helix-turn-helix transcriptional regulator n=1 Tax=Nocardia sp. NBC_00416 TaxID=2975991 RepID=UPI002E1B617F